MRSWQGHGSPTNCSIKVWSFKGSGLKCPDDMVPPSEALQEIDHSSVEAVNVAIPEEIVHHDIVDATNSLEAPINTHDQSTSSASLIGGNQGNTQQVTLSHIIQMSLCLPSNLENSANASVTPANSIEVPEALSIFPTASLTTTPSPIPLLPLPLCPMSAMHVDTSHVTQDTTSTIVPHPLSAASMQQTASTVVETDQADMIVVDEDVPKGGIIFLIYFDNFW